MKLPSYLPLTPTVEGQPSIPSRSERDLVTHIPLICWACAGSAISHGLREGAQRNRGHAKVTQRAGKRAERPAYASAQGLPMAQVPGVLGAVPSSATLEIWVPLPASLSSLGPTWGRGRAPECWD